MMIATEYGVGEINCEPVRSAMSMGSPDTHHRCLMNRFRICVQKIMKVLGRPMYLKFLKTCSAGFAMTVTGMVEGRG